MRIALISDIHGNDFALQAVLRDIERHEPDQLICLGDVATVGPQPCEVLERLIALNVPCVRGNHDTAMLDPSLAADCQIADSVVPTLHWGAERLSPAHIAYLQATVSQIEVELDERTRMLCYHGSPLKNTDLILATTPSDELSRLVNGYTAELMAGGHTHIQMLRQHYGKLVMNPGSVGNAFLVTALETTVPTLLPWAEYAIVNAREGVLAVHMHRVEFDTKGLLELIGDSDLPIKDWWLDEYARLPEN